MFWWVERVVMVFFFFPASVTMALPGAEQPLYGGPHAVFLTRLRLSVTNEFVTGNFHSYMLQVVCDWSFHTVLHHPVRAVRATEARLQASSCSRWSGHVKFVHRAIYGFMGGRSRAFPGRHAPHAGLPWERVKALAIKTGRQVSAMPNIKPA